MIKCAKSAIYETYKSKRNHQNEMMSFFIDNDI